jgi:DNA-binding transcriptional ArsR family regulator
MVELGFATPLDSIFGSLADPTRRDMLRRLMYGEMNIGELAAPYDVSFAAVSKHLKVLEEARLVTKRKEGRERIVCLAPQALAEADGYIRQYRQMWQDRFDSLEQYLKEEK